VAQRELRSLLQFGRCQVASSVNVPSCPGIIVLADRRRGRGASLTSLASHFAARVHCTRELRKSLCSLATVEKSVLVSASVLSG